MVIGNMKNDHKEVIRKKKIEHGFPSSTTLVDEG